MKIKITDKEQGQRLDKFLVIRFPDEKLKTFLVDTIEEKLPDTDPIIRLDVSDCTGHILTTLAYVQSDSWLEARQNLIQIHYKPYSDGNTVVFTHWRLVSAGRVQPG